MANGQVYFVLARDVGLVKIGRSIDIERRLSELRWLNPVDLELHGFIAGGAREETAYHQRWAHLRRRGEWFETTPELMTELEADSLIDAWDRASGEARQLAMAAIGRQGTRAA